MKYEFLKIVQPFNGGELELKKEIFDTEDKKMKPINDDRGPPYKKIINI